ncbi:MAG TPA: tetratricopeptide repeat protein [Candidatus Krumholzibacteria bacterium]|nr:tetratricopeptide repeat protein [Candidatus Krumholzibacteria bacterium]HRX50037.1 tetratricopeptide repeat protein [Candidatus Krumholzibacteria bacterium]
MSMLGRLLGRKDETGHHEGIALYDQGRYADAVPLLREAFEKKGSRGGSLVEFHLRQSLTHEGRRLLVSGDPHAAVPFFAEAAVRWPTYPDLHFWHGMAQARCERWDDALASAQQALRYNGDYVEARLLEACSLARLGAQEAAAESLDALVASGQRVDHPLVRYLATHAPAEGGGLPDDLFRYLDETVHRDASGAEVQKAVSLCRGGEWDEGIARLRSLCEEKPTYPDYRVKLAAALFQVHRDAEALEEVAEALILNPRYSSAAHLKALILADQYRFAEAREVILVHDEVTDPVGQHPGEALFRSYLRAALDVLTGRLNDAREQLDRWHDLEATFPMAALLQVAVNDLQGYTEDALHGLEGLASRWFIDESYQWYLACHLLKLGRLDRVEKLLESWPAGDGESAPTDRRRQIAALVALRRGDSLRDDHFPHARDERWQWLEAQSRAWSGDWLGSLALLRALGAEGEPTERLVDLLQTCLLRLDDDSGVAGLPDVMGDGLLVQRLQLSYRSGRTGAALAQVRRRAELHAEDLRWTWLDPTFWLEPIRRWIG